MSNKVNDFEVCKICDRKFVEHFGSDAGLCLFALHSILIDTTKNRKTLEKFGLYINLVTESVKK